MRHFTKPFENSYGFCMYREYWRVWVPLLLAPRHGTTSVDQLTDREEDRVREVLLQVKISSYLNTMCIIFYLFLTFLHLQPLEQFICGTEDVASVWRQLSECDAPPAVCGHVFRHGETCYSCK